MQIHMPKVGIILHRLQDEMNIVLPKHITTKDGDHHRQDSGQKCSAQVKCPVMIFESQIPVR